MRERHAAPAARSVNAATLSIFGALLGATVTTARAQQSPMFERAPRAVDVRSPATSRPAADDRAPIATARLVVEAAPESFRVVQVDIPRALLDEPDVRYQIIPGNVRLLSARTGLLHPTRGGAGLVFSVQLPASAQAGLAPMAEVIFTSRRDVITTAVDVKISPRWRTALAAMRAVYGARSGERVDVSFRVTNGSNTADTLDLQFVAPAGWRVDATRRRIILGAGDVAVESAHVRPPAGLTSGEAPVALVAFAQGVERARSHSTVRVAASEASNRSRATMQTSLAVVADRAGNVQTGLGVEVDAAITPSVGISARFAGRTNPAPTAGIAMPQMNMFPSSNHFTLSTPRWTAQAGAVGTLASELTGQLLVGSGGALQYKSDRVLIRAMAARSWQTDSANGQRSLLGYALAEVHRRDLGGYVSVAHIDDNRGVSRRLDALALGTWYEPSTAVRVAAEVADRSYVGGRGIGYSTTASATRPGSDFSFRFVSAPGGSSAGAQATQSAYLHAAHALSSRFRIAMDGWVAADSNDVAATRSTGWSIAPDVTLSRLLSAGVDVRGIGFESGRIGAGMSNVQHQVGAHARSTLGPVQLGVQVTSLEENRGFSAAGFALHDVSRRLITRGDIAYESAWGVIRATQTRTSPSGWMPAQRSVSLMVDQVRPIPAWRALSLQASAERVVIGEQTLASLRAALAVTLTRGTQLQLGVEQNNALRSVDGATPRYVFMRLVTSTGITVPNSLWSHSGIVFRDLNGNGVRDRGEPGFAGLVVRRGNESVVTDAEGRFNLPNDFSGTVAVDERSLPMGWMIGRSSPAGTNGRSDVPVVPTGRVEVVVALHADVSLARAVRLGSVTVVMTDASGRAWIAHTGADNRAGFDALPIGRYTVHADATTGSEPLIVTGPETVDVLGDGPPLRLALTASIRPVRVFQKPKSGTP